jgi:Protein of unknown function (DUF3558)
VIVRLFLLVVAAAALMLAGCSEETSGAATAGDGDNTSRPTIPTGDTGTSEPTESTETGGESGTTDLKPCDLLTSSEQANFNLAPGAEDDIGPARACQWRSSDQFTVTIGVIDELGLEDVQSNGATQDMKVGSHDAVQYVGVLDTCAIAIGVTDASRVDVSGVAGSDMTKACSVAKQAAELVEPKLP